MKKILTAFSFAMLGVAAMAQETYDNAQLATKDLNGTARYVGMGGAMEALGADITTMNTNPAGVGLFRRSMITGSFGFNSLSGTKDIGKDKTKASFDHVGFVYVCVRADIRMSTSAQATQRVATSTRLLRQQVGSTVLRRTRFRA